MTTKSNFYRQVILPSQNFKSRVPVSPADLKNYEKQTSLRPAETNKFRNSIERQLCIEMLQQSFHESFREICAILAWQKEDRARLGAEHPLHRRPLLEGEPDKLKYLCHILTKIEDAKRKRRYAIVYKHYLELATFFFKTEDRWLSDSFYEKCLIVAQTQSTLDPQFSSEAFLNVGLAYERRGELFRALENFEEYRRLSENYSRLRTDANLQLTRLYLKIANRKSSDEKLHFVLQAYEAAQQSHDEQTEFETAFQLGQVYLQHDQIDQALSLFHEFYNYCRKFDDYDGFGEVSQTLAICYQKKGDMKKSMSYLNRYLDRVSDHQNDLQFVRAASTRGLIQMTQNQYESALSSFSQAYSLSLANRYPDLDRYRVMYGIARGAKLRPTFDEKVEHLVIEDLIQWKSIRRERDLVNHQ